MNIQAAGYAVFVVFTDGTNDSLEEYGANGEKTAPFASAAQAEEWAKRLELLTKVKSAEVLFVPSIT